MRAARQIWVIYHLCVPKAIALISIYLFAVDTQFAFGVAHPIPGTFYSTAGTAPFIADSLTPTDGNEPYLDVSRASYVLSS